MSAGARYAFPKGYTNTQGIFILPAPRADNLLINCSYTADSSWRRSAAFFTPEYRQLMTSARDERIKLLTTAALGVMNGPVNYCNKNQLSRRRARPACERKIYPPNCLLMTVPYDITASQSQSWRERGSGIRVSVSGGMNDDSEG